MPGIAQLSTLLNLDEYRENASITVKSKSQNGEDVCTGIHFENVGASFENDYRFMASALVNEKLKTLSFNEPPYEVVLVPAETKKPDYDRNHAEQKRQHEHANH